MFPKRVKSRLAIAATALCTAVAAGNAQAFVHVIDVNNIPSVGFLNNPANAILNVTVGPGATVTGIGLEDVTLTAFVPSWLSEMYVRFTNTAQTAGVIVPAAVPDFDYMFSGTTTVSASYDLVSLGLSFAPGPNGLIRLQFYEVNSDDLPGTDGVWNSGRIVITTVPEPSTDAALALGLAGLFATTRRKFAAPRAPNSA